ncbi:MAG: Xaa-Pro peptidase family protein [Rhizobiaceae bacterium]
MHDNPFSDEELAARLVELRRRMAGRDLDLALVSAPENIFYLTGLDHWGYFAPHLLIVPADGEMTLVTRSMERVSVEKQVRNARFEGHTDMETAADLTVRLLRSKGGVKERALAVVDVVKDEIGGAVSRIGVETWSSGHSFGFGSSIREGVDAAWIDISGIVDEMRLVKSPAEQALMRRAAKVTDAAAGAAIEAISDGAPEREVAAECVAAMIRAGGDPAGFGPFIRPGSRLGEEHGTTGDGAFRSGEPVFLELSGCVRRYHAPLGRLVHLGGIRDEDAAMAETVKKAFDAVFTALKPGTTAGAVYQAWQNVVNAAGLPHYRRHHCGYLVGIGVPPSWIGGNRVTGLRAGSPLVIETGMSFHVLSWLMGTGAGDYFMSNPVLLTETGAEILTEIPFGPIVK